MTAPIVRGNIAEATATFTANDGSATQPSAATVYLTYKDLGGLVHTASTPMTYFSSSNTWVGLWDTSVAGNCTVDWVAKGTGTLQAATQGSFVVQANDANVI